MAQSQIEWTQMSWNPTTGCTETSPGCARCYAKAMAKRLCGRYGYPRGNPFKLKLRPKRLDQPFHWKKPRLIFVDSMSDLFHEEVPLAFIRRVFAVMKEADHHVYQVLTKRSSRLAQLAPKLPWPPNIWMGVSVENNNYLHRVGHLRRTKAAVKFLSLEPLIGPVPDLHLQGIDWVIVGGESRSDRRPLKREWVVDIRDSCAAASVPFFFKQWGGRHKKKAGRRLDGRIWAEMPPLTLVGAAGIVTAARGGRKKPK